MSAQDTWKFGCLRTCGDVTQRTHASVCGFHFFDNLMETSLLLKISLCFSPASSTVSNRSLLGYIRVINKPPNDIFALEKQKIIFMAGKLGNPISQRIIGF